MGLEVEKIKQEGAEWWKITVPKERAKIPVEAFAAAPATLGIGGILNQKASDETIDIREELAEKNGTPKEYARSVAIASQHTGISTKNLVSLFLTENGGKWDPDLVGVQDPDDIGMTQLNKKGAIPEITKKRSGGKSYFEQNFGTEFDPKNPHHQILGSAIYLNWLKNNAFPELGIKSPTTQDLFLAYKVGAQNVVDLKKMEKSKWPDWAKNRLSVLKKKGIFI
jgi:hypothetical protein